MLKFLALKDAYLRCESGATAVEYGIFITAIALAIVVIIFSLGDQIAETFGALDDAVDEGRGN